MVKNKKIDSAILTKLVTDDLVKNPEFIEALAHLQRVVSSLSVNIVKKITERFVADLVSGIADNVQIEKSEKPRRGKHTDWSKMPDKNLRRAYSNRKAQGKKIEPELENELVKRFAQYDKEAQKFNAMEKDWSLASDACLRSAYYERRTKGLPIEPNLNEQMAKRFSSYNKEKQKFDLKTDWSKSSKASVRHAYYMRKGSGKPIEPELNEELAKRFPAYDKVKQEFATKKTDWAKSSDASLRQTHHIRKKAGLPIEPELNEELAKRFKWYDKETQKFSGRPKTVTIKESKQDKVSEKKKNSISLKKQDKTAADLVLPLFVVQEGAYKLVLAEHRNKILLRSAEAPYELYLFDAKTGTAVVSRRKGGNCLMYVIDLVNGTIPDFSKRGTKMIAYDTRKHILYIPNPRSSFYTEFRGQSSYNTVSKIPLGVEVLKSNNRPDNTVIINKDGAETFCSLMVISDVDGMARQNKLVKHLLENTSFDPSRVINKLPQVEPQQVELPQIEAAPVAVPEQKTINIEETDNKTVATTNVAIKTPTVIEQQLTYKDMVVSVEPKKTTLEGCYNDVYVNGKKLLTNHVDTELRLLADNTLLAIHGIVTDNKRFSTIPAWLVYDTELNLRLPDKKLSFSKYNVVALGVYETPSDVRLDLNDKTKVFLSKKRMQKIAEGKRFVIEKQKTK